MGFRTLAIGLLAVGLLSTEARPQEDTSDVWDGVPDESTAAQSLDQVPAEDQLTALARIDPDRSRIEDFGANLHVELALSQPVQWRVFTLDAPRRLVMDFSEVDFSGVDLEALVASDIVAGLYRGRFREGWSRLVIELGAPMRIETAGLAIAGIEGAVLKLQMAPTTQERFDAEVGLPDDAAFALPQPEEVAPPVMRQLGDRPLRVTLDPGHGGFDPGAEVGGSRESDLMLQFALELAEILNAAGMEVSLTRTDDAFVPLPDRVGVARARQADLFLSLHADALAEGAASGASVYTLSSEASDDASQKLAERMDRTDLLAGVDLQIADDEVATILQEMVRAETGPRSAALADEIVNGLSRATGDLHKRPRLSADFSVLRGADIPSVLIELGFLSSDRDRHNLLDAAWRREAAHGIREGVETWARADAAEAKRLMQ
ncbi:N-acetylmuramoyl-L-alanine amidase [Palleronia abyssalis]|uniref:N-acetylmuramoyl-L-alanine amidase n=1 Tax=Palleronia abyssalis TaxID=1501240 RepID=A0A2R8BV06_9RHOB|nr:N-acetylmuramoyl-L-alanine amidase [Palleronia abyssalis]SPJ23926.1 N-acetylmuramoyl-L-alanine amidase AmiC [Palleronia abyssalis]